MRPLDLRDIQEACCTADQRTAGEGQLRDGLEAAFIQRPRTIGNPSAAFEGLAYQRMQLETLHFIIGAEIGVLVIQPDDKAIGHQIVFEVIKEGSAIGLAIQRPAGRMHDEAGFMLCRINFPQLLDANAIGLRFRFRPEIEFVAEAFGQ